MPTYQYACTACDHRFDEVQSFTDAALTTCPQCDGRLRKVFSPVGIVFRGSGFYRTDSRSGAGKNAGDPAFAGKKSEEDKAASKSESGSSDSGKSDSGKSGKSDSGTSDSGSPKSGGDSSGKSGDKSSASTAKAS